jgi:hypothetical protein
LLSDFDELKNSILSLQSIKSEILKAIETQLKRYKTMTKADAEEFKKLMFGRKLGNGEITSHYERILRTPGNVDLIRLIWKILGLWKKGFFFNMVKIHFLKYLNQYFSFSSISFSF